MSTEPDTTAETAVDIDTSEPPIIVGAQVADAVLQLALSVVVQGVHPHNHHDYWHGFLAAVTAGIGAHVGLDQVEGIMQHCIGYAQQMAVEDAQAKRGVH